MTLHRIKIATNKSTGMFPEAQRIAAKRQLNKFLKAMPEGTRAYIAGGAPRDWHHGWGCRDVDIFFSVAEDFKSLHEAYNYLNKFELANQAYGEDYSYGCGEQGILSIHEYPIYQGSLKYRKVQLIRLKKSPLTVINNFPINMSHIWMDSAGRITCNHHYQHGYDTSILRNVNDSQYYYPYLEKILPRMSKYAFVPNTWDGRDAVSDPIVVEEVTNVE